MSNIEPTKGAVKEPVNESDAGPTTTNTTVVNKKSTTKTTVVNKRSAKNYDVYIGRPSKWGNPFKLGKMSRSEVISKYREWIMKKPELLEDLHELKGKRIACWCKPLACHGDVLAELADKLSPK